LIFGRTVLQNPACKPEYLLYEGGYNPPKSCWPEYGDLVKVVGNPGRQIEVWKIESNSKEKEE